MKAWPWGQGQMFSFVLMSVALAALCLQLSSQIVMEMCQPNIFDSQGDLVTYKKLDGLAPALENPPWDNSNTNNDTNP